MKKSLFQLVSLCLLGCKLYPSDVNSQDNTNDFETKTFRQAKTICICQYGTHRLVEIPIMQVGCKVWLNKQSCDAKKTISFDDSLQNNAKELTEGDTLKVGYVGHWWYDLATLDFIELSLLDILQRPSLKVIYDNTACRSITFPLRFKEFLEKVKFGNNSSLTMTGAMTETIGMWEDAYKENGAIFVKIIADKKNVNILWPKCSDYENTKCTYTMHKEDLPICYVSDINDLNDLEPLECKKTKVTSSSAVDTSEGLNYQPLYEYRWKIKILSSH